MWDEEMTTTGPLKGIRVLDMTAVVLGPFATMQLGDLGADVIKVESPRGSGGSQLPGDLMRHAGATPIPGNGPMFMALNRNKKGISLDCAIPEHKETLLRLFDGADIFIHNVRMAGMKRLGLDYETLKARKPDIIYVHCAGFGSDGPHGSLPAYDDLIQAASGFTDLEAIRSGGKPAYAPSLIADKTVGMFALSATLAALVHKTRTGEGQFVEVPMLECFTYFNLVENLWGQTFEGVNKPMAYTRSVNANRAPYPTKDGYIALVPYSDRQWQRFLELGGLPGVFEDPRFSTYQARTENIGLLYGMIRKAAATRTTDEWLAILAQEDIPAMRANTLPEVLTDRHLTAVGMFEWREQDGHRYRAMKHPVRYDRTPASIHREPPKLETE